MSISSDVNRLTNTWEFKIYSFRIWGSIIIIPNPENPQGIQYSNFKSTYLNHGNSFPGFSLRRGEGDILLTFSIGRYLVVHPGVVCDLNGHRTRT